MSNTQTGLSNSSRPLPRVQCLLASNTSRMRAVLDQDGRLRPGVSVTLSNSADPRQQWEILELCSWRPPPELNEWMGGGFEIVYIP